MNKQKELAKNTIILTFGKICTQFISFMLIPLYTSVLTPEEFGVVDLFNTYIALLIPLTNWQFDSGLFRFMLDCRNDIIQQKRLFSTVIVSNIFQTILYLLFFTIAQNFITSEYKIFLAADVVLGIFLNTLLQFARGLGNNISYAVASFLSASTTVALNVVFIAGLQMGAWGLFCAGIIAKIVSIGYLMVSQKTWLYFDITLADKLVFKTICKYSSPLIPNQISWWVIGASDRTIISTVISIAANGVYSVANKFSTVFITFYNIFNLSWTESVALHLNSEDGENFLEETINSMFKIFSAACFGIIACMPIVFPLMVNKQYSAAYQQIPILMIAVLFQVIVGLYSVIYVALKKSREIAKTSTFAAIINIVADGILISFIGLYAASVSTMVAYASMAIYRYIDVRKYVNVQLNKKLIFATIIAGIVILSSYYINNFYLNYFVFMFTIVYALVLNHDFLKSAWNLVKSKIINR